MREIVADAAGRQLAGVVILSDGRNTTGPVPDSVVRAGSAASALGANTPIWSIPIGSSKPAPDISLIDVLAPQQLARGDTASIVSTIQSHGFAGRKVKVTLREGKQTLDKTELVLRDYERQQAHLTLHADAVGTRLLHVEVEVLGEETIPDNNTHDVTVHVDEQQWQVLYLEGYPRWDFRFLDHALRRDGGVDVRFVVEAQLQAELDKERLAHAAAKKANAKKDKAKKGNAASQDDAAAQDDTLPDLPTLAHLPEDASEFAEYHAVILGDVSPKLLPRRLQVQLVKAVQEEGVGLIVQAGPEHMPHEFADGPLAKILPVKLDPADLRADDKDGPGMSAPAYSPYRMAITAPGSIHPSLRLYDSATKNRQVWNSMSPFYWAAATDRAAPGATVLAEVKTAGATHPLIAEHFAGRGRVIFIGTDATYRWRRNIGNYLFYRFWGQAVRHVARAKDRRADESWMELQPGRVEPGEAVAVELYAVDGDGQPLTQPEVSVQVMRRDGEADDATPTQQTVTLQRGEEPGHYRGQWKSDAAGEFQLQRTGEDGKKTIAAVRVAPTGRELLDPTVDRDALGTLADLTGGGLLELSEIGTLPKHLKGEATTEQEVHDEELWDNWLTLVLLVGLYCGDVLARRMTGVV